MRSILTALAVGLFATVGPTLTGTQVLAGTPTIADGTVLKNCNWSAAGNCPFDAVKGTDYLIHITFSDCGDDGKIELINPVGQVTVTLPLYDCDSNYGAGFRAAYTATYQLR